jgi:hypothetical protein
MGKIIRPILSWMSAHPHSLVCLAFGLFVGALIKFPTGWMLPDPTASLIGAFAGAAAAVGGALWAANAKQHQEDAKADFRQRHLASMIAAAIFPEIASARRNFVVIADRLDEAIKEADAGNLTGVYAILASSKLASEMCEKFMDRFEAFGSDSSQVIEAVGAIFEVGATNLSLVEPIKNTGWIDARDVVVLQARKARFYADALERAILTLSKHHPRPEEVVRLASWPLPDQ